MNRIVQRTLNAGVFPHAVNAIGALPTAVNATPLADLVNGFPCIGSGMKSLLETGKGLPSAY